MTYLKKFDLDNELTYQYYCDCLEGSNELSSELIHSINFKSGCFFTILNNNIDPNKIYDFKYGGVAKGAKAEVKHLILNILGNNLHISAFFDAYNDEYAKEYNEPLFLNCGMHYNNEVYYSLIKETASEELLDDCLYASNATWHSLCVLSEIKLNPIQKKLSKVQIRDICLKTQLIIVGAYDAESYVFWEKTNTSQTDFANMNQIIKNNAAVDNKSKLAEMSYAYVLSRAIHVAATLGIADLLVQGPKNANELAMLVGAEPQSLYRLLRTLASHGIFLEEKDNSFVLTPLAQLLTTAHPDSLRLLLMKEDESRWNAYGDLLYSIKTGRPAFNHHYGIGYFDYIAKNRQLSESFDLGMANLSAKEDCLIANSFDFSPYRSIVDLGGGIGGLLAEILKKNPSSDGVVYELPHLMDRVEAFLQEQGLLPRCKFVSGSFFQSIPEGSDLYMLKRILHDWDDQACLSILRNCREAMMSTSRLLIIDAVMPEGNVPHESKDFDLFMLALFGGRERTQKEWQRLLEDSGLRLAYIWPTPSSLAIIEVEPLKS